jgi:translation initiation factor IF-2
MADSAKIRLNKVLKEFNISLDRAVDFLASKGHEIDSRPTTKISDEVYGVLQDEFQTDKSKKVASKEVGEEKRKEKETLRLQLEQEQEEKRLARERRAEAAAEEKMLGKVELSGPTQVGKIDLDAKKKAAPEKEEKPAKAEEEEAPKPEKEKAADTPKKEEKAEETESEKIEEPTEKVLTTNYKKLSGPTITDKIDLSQFKKAKKKKEESKPSEGGGRKRRRKRIVSKSGNDSGRGSGGRNVKKGGRPSTTKVEPTGQIQKEQARPAPGTDRERRRAARTGRQDPEGDGIRYRQRDRDHDGRFHHRNHFGLYVIGYDGDHEPAVGCGDAIHCCR